MKTHSAWVSSSSAAVSPAPLGDTAALRARLDEQKRVLDAARAMHVPIVGEIGADFAPRGSRVVRALDVSRQLRADHHRPVVLTIDSIGGSVCEARRIIDAVSNHRGPVAAKVPARCHSAAVMVLASAGFRGSAGNARFMLHPAGYHYRDVPKWLDGAELRRLAMHADHATEEIISVLNDRAAVPGFSWRHAVESGRTLTSYSALRGGLLHTVGNSGVVVSHDYR